MRDCRHRAIEQEGPPADGSTRHPAVEYRQPGNHSHARAWGVETGIDEKRVDHRLVATPPRNWTQGSDLGTDLKLENRPVCRCGWRHRVDDPAERHYENASHDHPGHKDLGRPR